MRVRPKAKRRLKNRECYANVSLQRPATQRWRLPLEHPLSPRAKGDHATSDIEPATGSPVSSFRFSPNPNLAHQIDWQPWGDAAFAKAQEEDKPVLLAISAVWCFWCHVMDETSYSDPDVARFIGEHFVAIRVDSDHRPDINARYNVGGWPSTAFLTGHGGLIGAATYLPPDQFLAMLAELQQAYQEQKPQLYEQARELLRQRKAQAGRVMAGPEIVESLVDRAARSVAGAYDATHGGFGDEPKFPNAPVLGFLVHLARTTGEDFYRAMLRKTLDGMAAGGIFDREEGGFFRHCGKADWSEPQWEKLLEENVDLARVYLDAWPLLDCEEYRQVAASTIDYVVGQLLDGGVPGFLGSQGAHSEYFGLSPALRREQTTPSLDPSCYAGGNARAVTLLLDASWKLGRPDLERTALDVLATLDAMAQAGRLSHVYTQAGPGDAPAFLTDWVHLLNALMSAHQHTAQTGYLERAKEVALVLVERFFDEGNGGFFDIEEDTAAVGYLQVREKPLAENLAAVMGLLKLYRSTRSDDYRKLAEATLSAYVDAYRDYGEFAAAYGLAVDLWRSSPVEITIEGRPGEAGTLAMLRAAARVPYPHLDIRLETIDDTDQATRALICLDTVCLPPVSDPDALADTVRNMAQAQDSPFENIFTQLPGL